MCNSEQKVFPCCLLLRLIFAHVVCIYDQCIYHSNVDHAIKHYHFPSASCSLYCIPCTCLIQHIYCTFCFVIKFNDFRLSWTAADCWIMMEWWKEDNWFFLLWGIWHKCLVNPKIDDFSSRYLAGLNSCGISLLFCFIVPTSVNFLFFSWFAWSTDVKKLSVVTFRPPLPWPEIGWTNVQTTSLANPRATSLFSLTK